MRNILFVAGDVSGDIHMALLAREVLRLHPDWIIYALGGRHLRSAGEGANMQLIGDTSDYGIIGFAPTLAILPRVLNLRGRVLHFLRSHRLDAAVLCDWGAFNGSLLAHLKKQAIPTLYYFPPRSWQKTGDGGLRIASLVTRVATPFEWSAQRLQAAGCNAEWVGHPLLETVRPSRPRAAMRREFGVAESEDEKSTLVALLPGSRALELQYIAPHLAQAAHVLRQNWPGERGAIRFVVAVPGGAAVKTRQVFPSWIAVVEGRAGDVLLACDVAVVKSGTATLEAAVANALQVVVYDGPPLLRAQWRLTGRGRKMPFVAMPNIILERAAVPELLGDDCRAVPIAAAVENLLENCEARRRMREDYALVRRALGEALPHSATQRTAAILDEMLSRKES